MGTVHVHEISISLKLNAALFKVDLGEGRARGLPEDTDVPD
jgi:hypothetical protein